ncbi:MAG: CBS domain-containing protein, partial [Chloroflexota bacterium]
GGRVLRSIVWGATKDAHRATQVATRVGEAFGWGLIILGALLALTTGELFSGLWMALIGWFLKDAASGTREQATAQNIFADTLVRDVMSPVHESVPVNTSVGDLVAEYFLPRGLRALPVTSAGRIAGIVTLSDVKELPQDQWDSTPVARIMTSDPLRYVEQDAHFSEAISMMQEHDLNQVLVLDGDQAVGMVNRTDVIRYMQVRKELGGRARGQDRSPYRPGE